MKTRRKYLKWLIPLTGILVALLGIGLSSEENSSLPDRVDYNYHIRPILSNNCYACHGPDVSTREADLRLDQFDSATASLENGDRAIVPGKPNNSQLIRRIYSSDPNLRMPPMESKKILTSYQKDLLKKWIEQGAEWKPHWAFIYPQPPVLSEKLNEDSPSAVIDHLLEKEQKRMGLIASPQADATRLARRLSYVLTGLPPNAEDVELLTSQTNIETYEKLVDQYLGSPQFGERWARHWMDVIRYAESAGHEADAIIGGAWRYRDYLIRAFNNDIPYDQFIMEHLAGDMLDSPRYNDEVGFNESVLATAFVCLGEAKSFPVNLKQEESERINTMIDVTSLAFQGLTVACARCHDHKFDPIPTSDYYAMYGMWESTRITPRAATIPRHVGANLVNMEEFKEKILGMIEGLDLKYNSSDEQNSENQLLTTTDQISDSIVQVIGDFRNGSWGGWSSDGWGFGASPVYKEVVFHHSENQFYFIEDGYASSRKLIPGLSGALRSPNFIIENDSLLIRARGNIGTIRVIIENYQPINDLLYGDLDIFLEDESWQNYDVNVSTWKGYQAYIEFIPGKYRMQSHKLQLDDYIEIEYVLAYNGKEPVIPTRSANEDGNPIKLNSRQRSQWSAVYDSLSLILYDSTHFIGLVQGGPVFSPVFKRGNYEQPGTEGVRHGFLSAIKAGPDKFPQDGSVRKAWARSVVDKQNPITSRIMVNRLWHYVFGKAIVETVDNFGVQGKLPSHPQLLDYIAIQFMEEGWSMKTMIKNMVMSRAFRRSTVADSSSLHIDAQNIFLSHYPVRRLEAEAIRDGVLFVSGRLDLKMYGEPVLVDYTPFLPSFKEGFGPKLSGPLDGAGRRSIYQMVQRNFLNPRMLTLDMPLPYGTVGQRNVSYTPAQSLSLLNDPFYHEQANRWAENLLRMGLGSDDARIQDIYLRAFARKPSELELSEAKEFLKKQAQSYDSTLSSGEITERLWIDYCHSIFNLKEFIHLL